MKGVIFVPNKIIMIQRVQTLFLLGIIICMGVGLAMPLVQLQVDGAVIDMSAFLPIIDKETTIQTFWIGLVLVLNITVAGFSISQFKNRLLQIKLGALISFLSAIGVGLILFLKGDYPAKFDIGIWAIMLALVFNFLANWFIRRDDKLVRDSNRLR